MARPCRQLNSKGIRGIAEYSILPIVSVIAIKYIWRVEDDQIDNAWRWDMREARLVWHHYEICGEFLFFPQSISTSESNAGKWKKKKESKTDRDYDWETEDFISFHFISFFIW